MKAVCSVVLKVAWMAASKVVCSVEQKVVEMVAKMAALLVS